MISVVFWAGSPTQKESFVPFGGPGCPKSRSVPCTSRPGCPRRTSHSQPRTGCHLQGGDTASGPQQGPHRAQPCPCSPCTAAGARGQPGCATQTLLAKVAAEAGTPGLAHPASTCGQPLSPPVPPRGDKGHLAVKFNKDESPLFSPQCTLKSCLSFFYLYPGASVSSGEPRDEAQPQGRGILLPKPGARPSLTPLPSPLSAVRCEHRYMGKATGFGISQFGLGQETKGSFFQEKKIAGCKTHPELALSVVCRVCSPCLQTQRGFPLQFLLGKGAAALAGRDRGTSRARGTQAEGESLFL